MTSRARGGCSSPARFGIACVVVARGTLPRGAPSRSLALAVIGGAVLRRRGGALAVRAHARLRRRVRRAQRGERGDLRRASCRASSAGIPARRRSGRRRSRWRSARRRPRSRRRSSPRCSCWRRSPPARSRGRWYHRLSRTRLGPAARDAAAVHLRPRGRVAAARRRRCSSRSPPCAAVRGAARRQSRGALRRALRAAGRRRRRLVRSRSGGPRRNSPRPSPRSRSPRSPSPRRSGSASPTTGSIGADSPARPPRRRALHPTNPPHRSIPMEVILRQSIDQLGQPGDIVKVSAGYARNFLLPRGLAYEATPGQSQAHRAREVAARSRGERSAARRRRRSPAASSRSR